MCIIAHAHKLISSALLRCVKQTASNKMLLYNRSENFSKFEQTEEMAVLYDFLQICMRSLLIELLLARGARNLENGRNEQAYIVQLKLRFMFFLLSLRVKLSDSFSRSSMCSYVFSFSICFFFFTKLMYIRLQINGKIQKKHIRIQ